MENPEVKLDPETEFLYSKQGTTGNEWELFKENVKPLKRGRNVRLLNDALKSHTDNQLKKSLFDTRRRLIEAIDEYKGDDPLQPWLECIKWVQDAFPPGGDCSGLVVIYEKCVRMFWHDDRYKDDLRYLKVWLEYAENCADAEVIYSFLEANKIGQTHSIFFISYALHMESKNKIKTANEIFNRGMSWDAQPSEKLKDSYKKFIARSMGRPKATEEDLIENNFPARSFGSVLTRGENRPQNTESSELPSKKLKQHRAQGTPLTIYKDTTTAGSLVHQPKLSLTDSKSWHSLGARAERNKENNAIPGKWTSNKIPRRAGSRTRQTTASDCIEVFVDEECAENFKTDSEVGKSTSLHSQDLKKETELLRENPLRNFPSKCLPR
ncbi:mitotic spindle checkpoint protein BUBR1 [Diospyros lotus]|uniref:mitotic spindle checkpoint protein BUBR1 n=1 Tax=Diospyros lotus TaxID=55363 RepID=UPI00225A02A3|nr:mitotic spindle checkpoint protein BUBR1 [Diospyros lotus]